MHDTEIYLKDGRKFSSPIEKQEIDYNDFGNSYIKLFFIPEIFFLCNVEKAITRGERISLSKLGDLDEIESMRREYGRARKIAHIK